VGGMLAELLDFNSVSAVSGLNIEGGELIVNREIDGGSQVLSVASPVVLIVQKGIAKEPRIPAMRGIMMARKKPLNVIPAIDGSNKTKFVSYEMPPPKASCKMVDEENAKELIAMLHEEAKVL
jgi:electron transfer flavoprotein beta subunit